jgi:Trypsin-like peptidase domain
VVAAESLWADRLAEVWADPGRAGAGVVVGMRGVLTSRHVISAALDGEGGRVLARVVRPGAEVARWVPMRPVWDSTDWDVALLAVDERAAGAGEWVEPASAHVVVASVAARSEPGCEAVGFPRAEVQLGGERSERVRQPEQARGTVLPVGQGRRPVTQERELPRAWMPLDVETATPETQADWGGMSGAGVVLADGRLVGVVVDAEEAHQQRRLYLVSVATVLAQAKGFRAEISRLTGRDEVAEARDAPSYRAVLRESSLGRDGLPRRLGELSESEELGVFGVKEADLPGESSYLEYVARDGDKGLGEALREAVTSRRALLVIGASASGKSRSASRVAADLFPERRLVVPQNGKLAKTVELLSATLEEAVVWLDDAENYAHVALRDSLEALGQRGAAVVATIRTRGLEGLNEGELRNPAGEALTDPRLVLRIDWKLGWNEDERTRLRAAVAYEPLLDAVARGMAVGVYCVAGPELVQKLEGAASDEERPARYALVRTVLDWFRTGTSAPIRLDVATELMRELATEVVGFDGEEVQEALRWATEPVRGFDTARRTSQSLLTLDTDTNALSAHDYLRDHDVGEQRVPADAVLAAMIRQYRDGDTVISAYSVSAALSTHFDAAFEALAEASRGPDGERRNDALWAMSSYATTEVDEVARLLDLVEQVWEGRDGDQVEYYVSLAVERRLYMIDATPELDARLLALAARVAREGTKVSRNPLCLYAIGGSPKTETEAQRQRVVLDALLASALSGSEVAGFMDMAVTRDQEWAFDPILERGTLDPRVFERAILGAAYVYPEKVEPVIERLRAGHPYRPTQDARRLLDLIDSGRTPGDAAHEIVGEWMAATD